MNALWLAPIHYNGGKDLHPAPWVLSLAESLTASGEVKLTILNYQPRLEKEVVQFEKDGIEYVFLRTPVPKIDYLTMYKKRINIIRNYVQSRLAEFDVIHVHGSEHQYEAVVHDLDKPVVMSMQGIITEYIKRLKNKQSYTYISWLLSSKYEKTYISKVKEFMCRTTFDTGFVKKHNPNARVHENWEMLRTPFFNDLYSEIPDCIMHIGGTNPLKGMSQMLQAYNRVRTLYNVRLKLVGKVDVEIVEQIMLHHNLKNFTIQDLELTGMLDANGVAAAFQESYMLVHPSLIDNSPNSICEAQVAGLPVVASKVGGVESLIDNNETGILTTLDPDNIALGIIALLKDKTLHAHISERSRAVARLRHDPISIHRKTIAIYNQIKAA